MRERIWIPVFKDEAESLADELEHAAFQLENEGFEHSAVMDMSEAIRQALDN